MGNLMTRTIRRSRHAIAVLLGLLAIALAVGAEAQAFELVARHSGMCLDVAWASKADEANMVQAPCRSGANQQWSRSDPWYGYDMLVAAHSGKCLDVAYGSTAHGAKVIQYGCWGGNNQRWKIEPLGNGYNRIVNLHSEKCLDVAWASHAHAAPVVQATCTWPNQNQQWQLVE
jgi:hypothetical protein